MRTHTISVLAAVAVLATSPATPAFSGFVSGGDLLASCTPAKVDPTYRLKVAECRGYVVGIADTFDCKTQALGFKWNSSTGSSQRDLVDVVVVWLRKHPGEMSYQANGLVAAALSEAFPCARDSAANPGETAAAQ